MKKTVSSAGNINEKAMQTYTERELLNKAKDFLKSCGMTAPVTGIILGSGLGGFSECIDDAICVPYSEIPGFSAPTAPGHSGQLIYGELESKNVLAMSGRFHYYEGYTMKQIVFPVRVMAEMGVSRLIITNAAGAINSKFLPGGFMVVSDHLNLYGENPLIGKNDCAIGVRFPDMTSLYDENLRKKLLSISSSYGIDIYEGVYAFMTGPSFETPAEIRALKLLGADAVGMSSVPEAIAAKHAGMEVAAISFLANKAAGIDETSLSGADVISAAENASEKFAAVVRTAVSV